MNRRQSMMLLGLAVLLLPALACQTVMGALGVGATSTPIPIPEAATALATVDFEVPTDLPGLEATLEAIDTPAFGGDVPEDVPVLEPNENLFTMESTVSYETSSDFETVSQFYEDEMPNNGWTRRDDSFEFGETAILNYEKAGQLAVVTISVSNGKTFVLIVIADN